MADVEWTKVTAVGNSDAFEVAFDATDKTTPILQVDPNKDTTVFIKTTGSATVQMDVYAEDPDNAGAISYTYVAAAATSGGVDYVVSSLGPVGGIDFTGTVTGGDTATIQVLQSESR